MALPDIMVAPNGARLGKSDHPALPITLPEICQTAVDCQASGAGGLHLHIRDKHGKHLLDAGKYQEALNELALVVPDMKIQITSEAAGIYGPDFQRQMVLDCAAPNVSVSIKEMARESDAALTLAFYQDCIAAEITVQHILYHPDELTLLAKYLDAKTFTQDSLQLLFVLGRYDANGASGQECLDPFIEKISMLNLQPDWAVCAFGIKETACLAAAKAKGGKCRVGFENSVLNADGSIAGSNAERVAEIALLP